MQTSTRWTSASSISRAIMVSNGHRSRQSTASSGRVLSLRFLPFYQHGPFCDNPFSWLEPFQNPHLVARGGPHLDRPLHEPALRLFHIDKLLPINLQDRFLGNRQKGCRIADLEIQPCKHLALPFVRLIV